MLGGEATRKRARSVGGASPVLALPKSAAASLVDVTVEDADALDCGVCFHLLKPPIFQCDVGHMVCSPCHDKLRSRGKCHLCGVHVATQSRVYRRCHGMERLVESIRVLCPHAAHGCTMRLPYHDRESHGSVCLHAPCHCPSQACGFVGSTAALLDHFAGDHNWPCITNTKVKANDSIIVGLRDGFNFLAVDCRAGAGRIVRCLILITVARRALARIISVHCIDPHAAGGQGQGATSKEIQCELWYALHRDVNSLSANNQFLIDHWLYQSAKFRVICTDLSNGLPKPDDCFQLVVPDSVVGDGDKDGFQVKVRITYISQVK